MLTQHTNRVQSHGYRNKLASEFVSVIHSISVELGTVVPTHRSTKHKQDNDYQKIKNHNLVLTVSNRRFSRQDAFIRRIQCAFRFLP